MRKSKVKSVKEVNPFGDHSCPHCKAQFIDPLDCQLQEGTTNCKCCGKEYKVTALIAKTANERKKRYDKACNRCIKETLNA